MVAEPHEWRAECKAALSDDKKTQEQARDDAYQYTQNFVQTHTESGEMSFRDKVIINKPHYKVHARKWEKMGSHTAPEDFDRLHDEQQGREDERGMQQIELPDIYKRKREFTGKRSINGVQD